MTGTQAPSVRFAPSPTGKLHVGNVRTALHNWLFAKGQGGAFLLRIDDTDDERSEKRFEDLILEDLAWLGLTHDRFARQSERMERYDAVAADLKARGLLYACYETPEELERKRKLQRARGLPPVYDRSALALSDEERAQLEAEGRKPHWRFKLSQSAVEWDDLVRGAVSIDTASVSDPVLIRADGRYLYTLPSVVDDMDFAITHVIRGEDHVTNTATQVELFRILGAAPPQFAHTSLLVGAEGEGLSKRLGSLSIEELREKGIEPLAITGLLAKLGTSDPVEPRDSLETLAGEFDFAKLGRAPARFDPAVLENLNAKLLAALPYEAVSGRLDAMGVGGGASFWEAIRDNLAKLGDARDWWAVVAGPVEPQIEDPAFLAEAVAALPEGPLDEGTWEVWTGALKAKTGAKGKALFLPLRLALTGRPHGPEMKKLLSLIGRDTILARLRGEAA